MRIPIPGIHGSRRLLSRTRGLYGRLTLSCTCDIPRKPLKYLPQRHLSTCGVHARPLKRLPRTQCWLLGHAPLRVVDQAHVRDLTLHRGSGVEHQSRSYVIDAFHIECRVCGVHLDRDPWTVRPKLAMGRDGGALGHLWVRCGRAARWAFPTRVRKGVVRSD